MAQISGYILTLSEDRMKAFEECLQHGGYRFGEPVPNFSFNRYAPLLCLVVNEGKIIHITLGSRGRQNQAGSGLSALKLDRSEPLKTPIPLDQLLENVPKKNKPYLGKRFAFGGLLTEKGFEAMADAIRKVAPQVSPLIDRYDQERQERIRKLSREVRQALAYQKEAVKTALSIAGIDRHPLQEWSPTDNQPVSFLDGLPSAKLREDPMVVHDLMHLPGFEMLKTYPYGAAVFESSTAKLTVILANRQPLEEQTGTDLIYFNETFQSFVMVQYKAMDKKNSGPARFYLSSDRKLPQEIARMDVLANQLATCTPNTSHQGFRLTDNPFFIKICSRIVFDPDDIGLIPGMYLPLAYWKLLETSPEILGERGGKQITYENVGRYMDNTEFITVVAKAWVGTTPSQSTILQEAIKQTLENGKAVAVAIKSGGSRTGHSIDRGDVIS